MSGAAASSAPVAGGAADSAAPVLEDLRARQVDLHNLLQRAWEENVKLMDAADIRRGQGEGAGTGVQLHLALGLQHGRLAMAKLVLGSLSGCGTCVRRCALLTPPTAAVYHSSAAALGWMLRCLPIGSASEANANGVSHEAMRPVLRRRTGRYADRKVSEEEKSAQRQRDKTYVAEDKWEASEAAVWFPRHPLKSKWDGLIMILIMYSCLSVPFRIGMMADAEGWMWLFEVCVTLLFLTDLAFNFNTAYLEGPNWVIDRGMIAGNYMGSWFLIDALSSFPVELVDLYYVHVAEDGGEPSTGMKALRALRMVRLLRMLRLLKVQQYIDELEDRLGVNMQILQIVKMILGMLYLMHLLGCFWFYVGATSFSSGAHDTSWLHEYDGGSGLDAPTDIQYLYSVYWALTTLTTVGYGDITPTNDAERTYALASLLVGALVFGFMLSSIGDLVSNVDKNAIKLDGKLDDVKDFTRWHKMPPDLAARVRKYFEVFYSRRSAMDEEDILANLAPALRREAVRHMMSKTVARIPMFSDEYCDFATLSFQLEVHPLLKPLVYELGEIAIHKRSLGDGLYFLDKGTIGACAALDARVLFAISDAGSCFGEHAMFNSPADLSYKAATRCEVYCLAKRDLFDLLERFPSARKEVAEFAYEDALRHKMLRYWAFRMVAAEIRGRDERIAAALQLQVAWMRRNILKLQKAHDASSGAGAGALAALMPGLFGLEPEPMSDRGGRAPSPRSSQMAPLPLQPPPQPPPPPPPPPPPQPPGEGNAKQKPASPSSSHMMEATAVQSALAAYEIERSRVQRKDQQLEAQVGAIQRMLEKLSHGLHTA